MLRYFYVWRSLQCDHGCDPCWFEWMIVKKIKNKVRYFKLQSKTQYFLNFFTIFHSNLQQSHTWSHYRLSKRKSTLLPYKKSSVFDASLLRLHKTRFLKALVYAFLNIFYIVNFFLDSLFQYGIWQALIEDRINLIWLVCSKCLLFRHLSTVILRMDWLISIINDDLEYLLYINSYVHNFTL